MCPNLIQIGSKTAEKNSAQKTDKQTDRQTNRHYENNGHLAVNQHRAAEEIFTQDCDYFYKILVELTRQKNGADGGISHNKTHVGVGVSRGSYHLNAFIYYVRFTLCT